MQILHFSSSSPSSSLCFTRISFFLFFVFFSFLFFFVLYKRFLLPFLRLFSFLLFFVLYKCFLLPLIRPFLLLCALRVFLSSPSSSFCPFCYSLCFTSVSYFLFFVFFSFFFVLYRCFLVLLFPQTSSSLSFSPSSLCFTGVS